MGHDPRASTRPKHVERVALDSCGLESRTFMRRECLLKTKDIGKVLERNMGHMYKLM